MNRIMLALLGLSQFCVLQINLLHAEETISKEVDVTGTWNTRVEVAGQTGEPTFHLDQKGNAITGKYHGSFGEHEVTGTVKESKIEFGFNLDQGGKKEKSNHKHETKEARPPDRGDNAVKMQKATFEYAEKDSQKLFLDRFVDPSANVAGRRPLIIFSIGGGWENGGRGDGSSLPLFNYLTTLGYTIVAIDYRPGIKIAKANGEMTKENGTEMYLRAIEWGVEDLFDATSYILERADEWNVDKDQIVIMGGSAGATNSLVAEFNVANDTELARAHLPQGFRYAGVISMAGAFWLKANTPLEFKSKPAPILFFHGAKDQLVTYDEVQGSFSGYGPVYYCRKFAGPEYPKWFVDYPAGDHVVAATPAIDCGYEMAAFLQKLVKERQEISLHTIEEAKVPKSFAAMLKTKPDRSSTDKDAQDAE